MLLLAVAAVRGQEYQIKIRNLSAGGMMAEACAGLVAGDPITVTLRNIGPVDGKVAWTNNLRFGVAFDVEIDPQRVRLHVPEGRPTTYSAGPNLRRV
jgi:hypothetical protein